MTLNEPMPVWATMTSSSDVISTALNLAETFLLCYEQEGGGRDREREI